MSITVSLPESLGFSVSVRKHASRIDTIVDTKPFLNDDVLTAVLENAGDFVEHVLSPLSGLGGGDAASNPDRRKDAYKSIFSEAWSGISLSQEQGGLGIPTILRAPLLEIMCSADPELWNYIDTSMLVGGLISNVGNDWLKCFLIPKVRAGEWAISFATDVINDSPCRMRATQQDKGNVVNQGIFRLLGTAARSDLRLGIAEKEYYLVKAMICQDGDCGDVPALFLVPEFSRNGDDQDGVLGWYVASMQNATNELSRLKHDCTLRASIGVIALKQSDWHQSRIDAWRAATLAYAGAIDLAERHADERVRLESRQFVGITSRILEFWVNESLSKPPISMPTAAALIWDGIMPDGGAAFRSWLNRIYQTVNRLDELPFDGSDALSSRLRCGAESLQRIVDDVLANQMPSSRLILDSSGAILVLFSKVLMCAEIANDALYAAQCVSSSRWDTTYLKGKIQGALHFAAQELPLKHFVDVSG